MTEADTVLYLKEDEKLLFSLRQLYRQYGYRPYRMSKFEKYELYAGNKDFLVSDRVITFSDTNGELLALKPDVTLSIVKNAAFRKDWKQKLYYHENVYRPAGGSRQFREIMQCGLECIGDLDSYDMFEVIRLAEKSLELVSSDCELSFSHLGILHSLLQCLSCDETVQVELLHLIATRNEHELSALFSARGWSKEILSSVKSLLALSSGLRDLPECLRKLELTWLSPAVLAELSELSLLAEQEASAARFDFSVINDIHYYNGIVFQGFTRGVSEKVLSGGRYDRLLARMDREGSAVGFAVYFGVLEQLFDIQPTPDADVLLLYDAATPLPEVLSVFRRLRDEGKTVSAQRCPDGNYRETMDIRRKPDA